MDFRRLKVAIQGSKTAKALILFSFMSVGLPLTTEAAGPSQSLSIFALKDLIVGSLGSGTETQTEAPTRKLSVVPPSQVLVQEKESAHWLNHIQVNNVGVVFKVGF